MAKHLMTLTVNGVSTTGLVFEEAGTGTLRFSVDRVTIEPFDLRQPCDYQVVIDRLDKVNAGTVVVGSLVAYDAAGARHDFGNGNSSILFSSEVMASLPNPDVSLATTTVEILAWWED